MMGHTSLSLQEMELLDILSLSFSLQVSFNRHGNYIVLKMRSRLVQECYSVTSLQFVDQEINDLAVGCVIQPHALAKNIHVVVLFNNVNTREHC